jgi:NTE family protein
MDMSNDPSAEITAHRDTKRPKIGLVLGSGMARGWAHIGVIRALARHGIKADIVSGTSMGALVGGAHLSNKLDELEEWATSLSKMKIMSYLDVRVRSGGMIGGKKLLSLMEDNFGDIRIEDLPKPMVAIATDMVTGHEVWLRKGRLVDVMRASFAVPGVFPPVWNKNRWLIDGALVNPVPVSVCQALGASMTIAVNLSGDIIGKARRPGTSIPTIAGFDPLADDPENREQVKKVKRQSWARRIFKRDPNSPSLFGVMVSAMNIAQDRLTRSRLAGEPPDVHITPRIGHIGLMEFERAEDIIQAGEAAVERALPDIRDAYDVLCTPPDIRDENEHGGWFK